MYEGKVQAQLRGQPGAALGPAHVGAHQHRLLPVRNMGLDPGIRSFLFKYLRCFIKTNQFPIAGLANRLSTGMEKNPCIWPACRSMVTRWSAPAVVRRSATSRAMMGLRGLSTFKFAIKVADWFVARMKGSDWSSPCQIVRMDNWGARL